MTAVPGAAPQAESLPRICIVAEHASTRFGGEAILPVHYFRFLRARGADCYLVVHSRTREELEGLFPGETERIVFIPDLWIHRVLFRIGEYLPRRVSVATLGLLNQLVTQFCQRGVVRRLVRAKKVDLVHQPIPVAPRFPSALFGLGVPVVIGPLNGGMEYPKAFVGSESWLTRASVRFGRIFSSAVNHLLPGKLNAAAVLVANERTRQALPNGMQGAVIELVENGIDLSLWRDAGELPIDGPPRFVFVGRLVDWKALDVVLEALARVPGAELEVIGEGSMRAAWTSLADELGISERVHFAGWQSQETCVERLREALALVLPSIYECGGAVVLEAMAMSRPVIATRWGGPADYLNAECGVLLEPTSREALVDGFARSMNKLCQDRAWARRLGAHGRQRAAELFDWTKKVDRIVEIYRAAINADRCRNAAGNAELGRKLTTALCKGDPDH